MSLQRKANTITRFGAPNVLLVLLCTTCVLLGAFVGPPLQSFMSQACTLQQQHPGDAVIDRFHWSVSYLDKTYDENVTLQWHCPEEFRVGFRTDLQPENEVGTPCEPWIVRPTVLLLHELLLPGTAKALEWSSGSSTPWLLRGHVAHLTSVEHDPAWAGELQKKMPTIFGQAYVKEHWDLHIVLRDPPDSEDLEDPTLFVNYTAVSFLGPQHLGTFDFISIDGRARAACFPRALELLKPHGGVLMLDNSNRPVYNSGIELVPKHWLRYEKLVNQWDQTTVWVSCMEGSCGGSQ